jgi:hypothetical protein
MMEYHGNIAYLMWELILEQQIFLHEWTSMILDIGDIGIPAEQSKYILLHTLGDHHLFIVHNGRTRPTSISTIY